MIYLIGRPRGAATLKGETMTYKPVAYVDGYNGAMLCPDHGAEHEQNMRVEYGDGDEAVPTPVMGWDEPLDILQTCDQGHPFCGNCGAEWFDISERHHHGHLSSRTYECQNCGARARFIEGAGAFEQWRFGDGRWHYIEGTA